MKSCMNGRTSFKTVACDFILTFLHLSKRYLNKINIFRKARYGKISIVKIYIVRKYLYNLTEKRNIRRKNIIILDFSIFSRGTF